MKKFKRLIAAVLACGMALACVGTVLADAQDEGTKKTIIKGIKDFGSSYYWYGELYDGDPETKYADGFFNDYWGHKYIQVDLDDVYYNIKAMKIYGPKNQTQRIEVFRYDQDVNNRTDTLYVGFVVYNSEGVAYLPFSYNSYSRQGISSVAVMLCGGSEQARYDLYEIAFDFYDNDDYMIQPITKLVWFDDAGQNLFYKLYDGDKENTGTDKITLTSLAGWKGDGRMKPFTDQDDTHFQLAGNYHNPYEFHIYTKEEGSNTIFPNNLTALRLYSPTIRNMGLAMNITDLTNGKTLFDSGWSEGAGYDSFDENGVMTIPLNLREQASSLNELRVIFYYHGGDALDLNLSEIELIAENNPNVSIADAAGNPITQLTPGAEIKAKAYLFDKKNTGVPMTALAVYKDNKLINIALTDKAETAQILGTNEQIGTTEDWMMPYEGNDYLTDLIKLPDDLSGVTVKAFLIDGTSIKPIAVNAAL